MVLFCLWPDDLWLKRGARTFGLSLCFLVESAKIISIPPNRFYQLWTQGIIEDDLRTSLWIGWWTNVCRLGWDDPSYPLCWGLLRIRFNANYSWISKAKKWPLVCSHPATCSGIALLQRNSLNARSLWNNLLQPGARCRFPTKQLGSFLFVAGWPVAQETGTDLWVVPLFPCGRCKDYLNSTKSFLPIVNPRSHWRWFANFPLNWMRDKCRLGWKDPSYPLCWGLLKVPFKSFKANYSWISKAKKWPLVCSHPATCAGIALLNARGLWTKSLRAAVPFFPGLGSINQNKAEPSLRWATAPRWR